MGLAITVYCTVTNTLTVQSLGLIMFFIGLVPVTRADRSAGDPPTKKIIDKFTK